MYPKALCLFVVLVACAGLGAAEEGGPTYGVLKKEVLGGAGSWDYLTIDAAARRLYIARESRVMVVDPDTCKLIKEIPQLNGVHGVALAPEFNRGFVSNGRDNTVVVFDLKTLEKTGTVKTGAKPDAIIYDPASRRVFAFNGGGNSATAIDAATGQAAGTVELGGGPEFAVSDGAGHVYVNLEDKSEVVAFDPVKLTVLNHWPLKPGTTPTGLAMDVKTRRLFSGCRGSKTLIVLDADSGAVVASLPIGAGVDAVTFDSAAGNVFSSNGADANLTVIHEDAPNSYRVIQTLATQAGARTMAFDSKTQQVYLVTAETKPGAEPNKRRTIVPDTFTVIVVGMKK